MGLTRVDLLIRCSVCHLPVQPSKHTWALHHDSGGGTPAPRHAGDEAKRQSVCLRFGGNRTRGRCCVRALREKGEPSVQSKGGMLHKCRTDEIQTFARECVTARPPHVTITTMSHFFLQSTPLCDMKIRCSATAKSSTSTLAPIVTHARRRSYRIRARRSTCLSVRCATDGLISPATL